MGMKGEIATGGQATIQLVSLRLTPATRYTHAMISATHVRNDKVRNVICVTLELGMATCLNSKEGEGGQNFAHV